MAGGALGSLNVSLLLETVEFRSEMTRAAYLVNQNVGKMVSDFNAAGAKIGGILKGVAAAAGVGLSADWAAGMVNGAIQAQEELGRLAEKAGMTGAQMSSLSEAAKLSHTQLDEVANMSAKLSKALVESQVDTSKQASVLRALGISADEAKRMLQNPADGLLMLSKRLQAFADDGNKSAATMLLIGRGAAESLPFLNRLAQEHELVAKVTDEQVRAASEYEDKLIKLAERSDALKRSLANALLPTMSDVVDAFTKITGGANSTKAIVDQLASDGSIKEWAQSAAVALAIMAESIVAVGRAGRALGGSVEVIVADIKATLAASNAPKMKLTGSLGFTPEEAAAANAALDAAVSERNEILARANKRYADLWGESGTKMSDSLRAQFAASDAAKANAFHMNADRAVDAYNAAGSRPSLNIPLENAGANDALRKSTQGDVNILEQWIKEEEQLLANRESMLSRFYGDGVIGIQDYFGRLNSVRQEEIGKVTAFYDRIIADWNKAAAAAKAPADAIEFQDRAVVATIKKQEFLAAALQKGRDGFYDQAKAARDYADSVTQTQAAIAAMQGKGGFAGPLFDIQHRTDYAKADSNNDPAQRARLDVLKQAADAQDKITLAERNTAVQMSLLNTAQSSIDVQRQTMAIGEIEALRRKSLLNAGVVEQLRAQADAQEALAKTLPLGIVRDEQLAKVAALRQQIQGLAAQTDLLGTQIQKQIADNFTSAFTDFMDGTKSAKAAFTSFAKSVQHDVNNMLARQLSDMLFGKSGPMGGAGGLLSGIFGGGGGGVVPGSSTGGLGGGLTGGLTGGLLARWLTPASATSDGFMSGIMGMFGKTSTGTGWTSSTSADWTSGFDLAGAADGGPAFANVPMWVGERGTKELFVPETNGTVIPQEKLGGGKRVQVTNNFTVPPTRDRRSQAQIANDAYTGTMRAVRV